MSVEIPSFEDALKTAEAKLSRSMGGECVIAVHHGLDEELKRIIMAIDHEKFREGLQYDSAEIDTRADSKGFLLLLLHLDGRPVGFDYGYENEEEGAFFSDSSATLIERKGVGSTLFALELIDCYWRGYRTSKLVTEERDEQGRPLREIWGKFGFTTAASDPKTGIEMRLALTPDAVAKVYKRYIAAER
ncbi:MAG TPA: hypothetical protein VMW03_07925 [Candidatus Krumholzibacteriaceae bacterium]|nr:hypothetical protein [Candidatus Krumholzibacteriaceae bacterium]